MRRQSKIYRIGIIACAALFTVAGTAAGQVKLGGLGGDKAERNHCLYWRRYLQTWYLFTPRPDNRNV